MTLQLEELMSEDFETENKQEIQPRFYCSAESEEIQHALKVCIAASAQSGLKIIKTNLEESRELLALNAEDCEATVIQSITSHFNNQEMYDFELGSHEHNPDILFIVAETEEGKNE